MSVKKWGESQLENRSSGGGAGGGGAGANEKQTQNAPGPVVRSGVLKKLKTCRKKYFVLRAETPHEPARLEYYDNDRKYYGGGAPKRAIYLNSCFNINRRVDTKHKHVIALYTKDDCFCIVLESEDDLDSWLKALLSLQRGEEVIEGETPKPTFEHVWQVTVLKRGLGTGGITGNYRLCLTDKTLSFIRRDTEIPRIELNLSNIRSCGNLRDFFFLEIGRSSTLGAGELWMQTEDHNIAQNVHSIVFHAMSTCNCPNKEELALAPKIRNRSSSATEASKPSGAIRKQITSSGLSKPQVLSQDVSHSSEISQIHASVNINTSQHATGLLGCGCRERCDSMPSRARTTSEGNHPIPWNQGRIHLAPYRPVSLHGRDISHSPPSGSPHSPPSVGCSTDSAGSSYSLPDETDMCDVVDQGASSNRYAHSLTPEEAIVEEECSISPGSKNYISMAPPGSDDGYVDMSPRLRLVNTSPFSSMSSVTSGTPSTDMRFAEYPLEKVVSYFPPNEEEDAARPARAYSFGSRPETYRYRKHVELAGTPENSRVRAFSVGSKKIPGRILPHTNHAHSNGNNAKSSSAPILSNTRVQSCSYGSIGPMDDLMEMDFSRSGSVNNSDYLDMKPGNNNNNNNNNNKSTPSGYVEMKPGVVVSQNMDYVEMKSGTSPNKSESSEHSFIDFKKHFKNVWGNIRGGDYMDMDHKKNKNKSNCSPLKRSESPKYSQSPSMDYLDIRTGETCSAQAQTPEGYVEMTLGKGHQRQSSLDSAQIRTNDDYAGVKKKERKLSKKEKTSRSQPITIATTSCVNTKSQNQGSQMIYASTTLGRKYSSGTPPKMHLPLASWNTSPYSSLPRQRSRKNSRRDSNSSSSSVVTTPSSSSTIFPISLNSPCSPAKPIKSETTPTSIKVPSAVLNTVYKSNKTDGGYIVMDFNKNNKPTDYVNLVNDDYAVMQPTSAYLSTMGETRAVCFRPINENKEDSYDNSSPKPGDYAPNREPESPKSAAEVFTVPSLSSGSGDCSSSPNRPHSSSGDSISIKTITTTSRPSSASSELCSSSSTIIGSRPESVNSDRIRPSSVSSDVQLHYASLDLEDGNRSPRAVSAAAAKCATNDNVQCESGLTYASIDFIKSEGLKQQITGSNSNKVKH